MKKCLILIVALGMFLGGCKTTRQVQREVIRDTIAVYHHDTVRVERVKYLTKDSIVKDTIIIVKDTAGKIVYKEVIRDRYVGANKADTARFYVARKDSATTKKEARREEIKEVNKENIISRAKKDIVIIVTIAAVVGLLYWLRKRRYF